MLEMLTVPASTSKTCIQISIYFAAEQQVKQTRITRAVRYLQRRYLLLKCLHGGKKMLRAKCKGIQNSWPQWDVSTQRRARYEKSMFIVSIEWLFNCFSAKGIFVVLDSKQFGGRIYVLFGGKFQPIHWTVLMPTGRIHRYGIRLEAWPTIL